MCGGEGQTRGKHEGEGQVRSKGVWGGGGQTRGKGEGRDK